MQHSTTRHCSLKLLRRLHLVKHASPQIHPETAEEAVPRRACKPYNLPLSSTRTLKHKQVLKQRAWQAVEPNPAQPGGFRLRVKMQLVRSSLWVQVASTSIGYISADHLQARPGSLGPCPASLCQLCGLSWACTGNLRGVFATYCGTLGGPAGASWGC